MYKRPNAPFKPPRPFSAENATPASEAKKPGKIAPQSGKENSQLEPPAKPRVFSTQKRIKLARIDVSELPAVTSNAPQQYFRVQWRKRSNKKNKLWEGDGYIVVGSSGLVLKIEDKKGYKIAGRSKLSEIDGILKFGSYEAEVDCQTTAEEIRGTKNEADNDAESPKNSQLRLKEAPKSVPSIPEPLFVPQDNFNSQNDKPSSETVSISKDTSHVVEQAVENASNLEFVSASGEVLTIDPSLASKLRPHQMEGLKFLLGSVLNGDLNESEPRGALLADEMGLGKTLTTIALIWTLFRRGIAKKTVICCPVTLIDNWRREFKKWVDMNRIGVLCLNSKHQSAAQEKQEILNFAKTNVYQVLIISYEKMLTSIEALSTVLTDLLICDEGHRLKNATNKVLKNLTSLGVPLKIVLSGTPIQNDLKEFYNIAHFINPNILGLFSHFQKAFLKPILLARDIHCVDPSIIEKGREASEQLVQITKKFMIRRTKSVIESDLPPRTDLVVFCRPSSLQKKIYEAVLKCGHIQSSLESNLSDILPMILLLRKLCNSPSLLANDTLYRLLITELTISAAALSNKTSGSKVNVLIPLLLEFRAAGEKVVLVSNYTSTLDLLDAVLRKLNIHYSRLDGNTPGSSRDLLVTSFNRSPTFQAFLLSAKAGGVGLNLIGALRLILFDNEWNPLVDLQAMARIHREGQKRPTFIYRLLTTGTIDEKIFQRQLMKTTLSDTFVDDSNDATLNIFDYEDLRDLFSLSITDCNTHDLVLCGCQGNSDDADTSIDSSQPLIASLSFSERPSSGYMSALDLKNIGGTQDAKRRTIRTALNKFRHIDPKIEKITGDPVLDNVIHADDGGVSFVLVKKED